MPKKDKKSKSKDGDAAGTKPDEESQPATQWICAECEWENEAEDDVCAACEAPRPIDTTG